MLSAFNRDARGRCRPRSAVIAASLEALAAYLRERGHASTTVAMYERAAGHFARWLVHRKLQLAAVQGKTVQRFLDRHLPRCHCPAPGPRTRFTVRAALHHFLMILRRDGHVPQPASGVPSAIATAVASYDTYLRDTCGLAEATRLYRRRYAREFLQAAFGGQPVTPATLEPVDIERFVSTRGQKCRPGSTQVLASSIRSWLRYQQVIGACSGNLVAAVPRIPQWRLATLPRALTDQDVHSLLVAFDRTSPTGMRDYAMARCLIDLGLRATEVAHLQLGDVDWRQGRLRVAGTKNRRSDWLPLPKLLGQAIAAYLRQGRPRSVARSLFVRHHVPRGAAIRPSVVRLALERAATAADLGLRWRGPHSLRHTMATRLLRGSASLKEIADVLRHRSFDTTAIYAKVDLDALTSVAMLWPGRTP